MKTTMKVTKWGLAAVGMVAALTMATAGAAAQTPGPGGPAGQDRVGPAGPTAQDGSGGPGPAGPEALPAKLGAMQEVAARRSPALVLFAAKLEQARSKLEDTKLQVSRDAIAAYTTLRDGRSAVQSAEDALKIVTAQFNNGVTTQGEMVQARRERERLEVAFSEALANSYYVLGRVPKEAPEDLGKAALADLPTTLKEFLVEALKSHPILKVEECAVRLAEVSLANERLRVARDVTASFYERRYLAQSTETLRRGVDRIQSLVARNTVSQSEVTQAILELAKAESALATVEANLRYLLGLGWAAGR